MGCFMPGSFLCSLMSPRVCSNSWLLSWWCHPSSSLSVALFLLLSSIFPSIGVFSKESTLCIRWPKYWSFSFTIQFSSVQSLSHVQLFVTTWTTACQASLSITNSRVYPNSCPLSQWCNPTTSSSVVPFSFCPQSFPASGSFPMSQLFASGGQSIRVSASTSVLPMNTRTGLL